MEIRYRPPERGPVRTSRALSRNAKPMETQPIQIVTADVCVTHSGNTRLPHRSRAFLRPQPSSSQG